VSAAPKLPTELDELAAQLEALGFVRRRPRAKRTPDVVVSEVDVQRAIAAAKKLGLHVRSPKR
jgi:hypothetical protein